MQEPHRGGYIIPNLMRQRPRGRQDRGKSVGSILIPAERRIDARQIDFRANAGAAHPADTVLEKRYGGIRLPVQPECLSKVVVADGNEWGKLMRPLL